MSLRSVITATGSYLPARVVSNAELAQRVDTSDEWIVARTGIRTRHLAAEGETSAQMAVHAARAALEMAAISSAAIDGIVLATSTPDTTMPSTAAHVQAALPGAHGAILDVMAACNGFVSALSVAHGWIQTGIARNILVIGSEVMSRIIDWEDRSTCILFGDGAGAVLLQAVDGGSRGIAAITLEGDGSGAGLLGTNGGVGSTGTGGHLFMRGQEVFRHGVEKMSAATRSTLARAGCEIAAVDWLVPHQANARMIQAIGRELGVAQERCLVTVDRHANTSAATIPLALDDANRAGKLSSGQLIAMPALGAGLAWGCCVAYW